MERPYRQIDVVRHGPICCVRLREQRLDDDALEQLGVELHRLIDEEGCRRLVLDLAAEDPQCLYSILLAKLVNLQRHLESIGGRLALARVGTHTLQLFQITNLEKFFRFYPDSDAAVQALSA